VWRKPSRSSRGRATWSRRRRRPPGISPWKATGTRSAISAPRQLFAAILERIGRLRRACASG